MLMREIDSGIEPLSQTQQQARANKKQQQQLKLRQKQLAAHMERSS